MNFKHRSNLLHQITERPPQHPPHPSTPPSLSTPSPVICLLKEGKAGKKGIEMGERALWDNNVSRGSDGQGRRNVLDINQCLNAGLINDELERSRVY